MGFALFILLSFTLLKLENILEESLWSLEDEAPSSRDSVLSPPTRAVPNGQGFLDLLGLRDLCRTGSEYIPHGTVQMGARQSVVAAEHVDRPPREAPQAVSHRSAPIKSNVACAPPTRSHLPSPAADKKHVFGSIPGHVLT